jgi:hypothetical protein
MHLQLSALATASMVALIPSVAAHANILNVQGLKAGSPAGPVGMILGLDPSTPRNGQAVDPNQRDVTIFLQRSRSLWNGCGQSIEFGVLRPADLIPKLVAKGQIAQALAGGQLYMTLHQVNGDGNGPFTCAIDPTAAAGRGGFKVDASISRQVPGQNPTLNAVLTTQFPLIVNIPAGLECTGSFGGKNNICLMRCQNFAINGPFGGCIPFQLVSELKANFKRDVEDPETIALEKRAAEETAEPEIEKPATDDQIDALLKKMTKDIPGANQKRATTSDGVTTDDVLSALTEGDDVPPAELAKLKATVDQKIQNDDLPTKVKSEGKKHKGSKFGWKNRARVSRPPAAPTKGA